MVRASIKQLPFNYVILPFILRHGSGDDFVVQSYSGSRSGRPSSKKLRIDRRLWAEINSAGRRLRRQGGLSATMILSNQLSPEQELRSRGMINRLVRQFPWLTILDVRRSLTRLSHVEVLVDGLLASDLHLKIFKHLGHPTTASLFADSSIRSKLVPYSSFLPDHAVDISLDDPQSPQVVVVRRLKSYPFLCRVFYIQSNDGNKILKIIDGLKSEGYRLSPVALRFSRKFRGSSLAERKRSKPR